MDEALAADRARALALTNVSRETLERLDRFVALLLQWQRTTNLIAPSTVPRLWTRHIADSLQLIELAPAALVWIDLGSGGGFPGLPIACALAEMPAAVVHLVESNQKKAAFLRESARVTGAPAIVHAMRIEKFVDGLAPRADAVTARAVGSLKALLNECFILLQPAAVGLFPKGQDVEAELTEASKYWNITGALVPSRTDPKARIVVVRSLQRRQGAANQA
ncbi:MAG TPA: 16S rRNA (guanine(527)-N(7))-methyltransferase RsmG [Xanthobacteraceae bacterium]|jgi:16S rRNA (guanine527-N7)-methyltransferase